MPAYSMPTVASPPPHYVYDPTETLDQFRTRQARAYAAGRRAWRERLIKAHLLPFYEALVGYVGQNQYAWVKEQTLADEFEVHVATIKRWLSKLEDAGLIRRQRRFATSSLTFIAAYDNKESELNNTDNLHRTTQQIKGQKDYRQNRASSDGSRTAPTLGAKMLSDSIKIDHLMSVGGRQSTKQEAFSPEVQQLLAREGVTEYVLTPIIQQKPFVELQAISGYLSRQRNVHDRPRLFAWLASRDFGAQLLHGRRHSSHRDKRMHVKPDVTPRSNQASANPLIGENLLAPDVCGASVTGNQTLWQSVLTALQHEVPLAEFATWLKDTTLLDVDHERQIVVVGTPNVFARDVIQQNYIRSLSIALSTHLHQAYTISVVVDSP